MSNLIHLQRRNAKVKFMSRILEKNLVGCGTGSGFETIIKVGSRSEKNHTGCNCTILVICARVFAPWWSLRRVWTTCWPSPCSPSSSAWSSTPATHSLGSSSRHNSQKLSSQIQQPSLCASRSMKSLASRSLFFLCNSNNSSILLRVQSVQLESSNQCCGSGMFISDPNFFVPDPNFSISDPGSASKNWSTVF